MYVAHQADAVWSVVATASVRAFVMVELQPLTGLAAFPPKVHEGAATPVPLVNDTPRRRRNVA